MSEKQSVNEGRVGDAIEAFLNEPEELVTVRAVHLLAVLRALDAAPTKLPDEEGLTCVFGDDKDPAVALAPQVSLTGSGTEWVWRPACAAHLDDWWDGHDETMGRRPIVPLPVTWRPGELAARVVLYLVLHGTAGDPLTDEHQGRVSDEEVLG